MRTIAVEMVDAFIDGDAGGNVAGVVFEGAAELSRAQRQEVARQVAVSETAFVLPSQAADYKLEFYTPTRPIPHCGHATVGTFARLAERGQLTAAEVVNETIDGPRRVRVQDGLAYLEQVPARLTTLDESTTSEVLASLGLRPEHLLSAGGPLLADNGNRSIQIGVVSAGALRAMRPNMERIAALTRRFDAVCYYAFALDPVVAGRDATARMFGPAYGIPEESATGMAAGPLALWLDAKANGQRDTFRIEQGHLMEPRSPSLILAQAERLDSRLSKIWIGGRARLRERRSISIA